MVASYIPSGLGETFAVGQETTFGTFATPTRWFIYETAPFQLKKTIAQSKGLHGGLYELAQRRVYVAKEATGKVTMDVVDKGLGILIKNMLGSTATAVQQGASTAYLQTHTPNPTGLLGTSLSVQKGIPTSSGGIQCLSYEGCKVLDWQLSVKQGEIAKIDLGFDAVNEDVSQTYTAATYTAANPLHFAEGVLTIGGSQPTGVVRSVTIKSTNALDVKRFPLGSQTKKEQLDNGFRKITGEAEIEFASVADAYTAMAADTPVAIALNFTGALITGAYYAQLNTTLAKCFLDEAPISATGPEVIIVKTTFTTLDDGTDPVISMAYQSTDTSV